MKIIEYENFENKILNPDIHKRPIMIDFGIEDPTRKYDPLVLDYKKDIIGNKTIINLLNKASSEILTKGNITKVTMDYIYYLFGRYEGTLGYEICQGHLTIIERKKLQLEDPEKYKDLPDDEECRMQMRELIALELEEVESRLQDIVKQKKEELKAHRMTLNVTLDDISVRRQRYQTTLRNQLYGAIDRLYKMNKIE